MLKIRLKSGTWIYKTCTKNLIRLVTIFTCILLSSCFTDKNDERSEKIFTLGKEKLGGINLRARDDSINPYKWKLGKPYNSETPKKLALYEAVINKQLELNEKERKLLSEGKEKGIILQEHGPFFDERYLLELSKFIDSYKSREKEVQNFIEELNTINKNRKLKINCSYARSDSSSG